MGDFDKLIGKVDGPLGTFDEYILTACSTKSRKHYEQTNQLKFNSKFHDDQMISLLESKILPK